MYLDRWVSWIFSMGVLDFFWIFLLDFSSTPDRPLTSLKITPGEFLEDPLAGR